jgi:hypothetical protein
MPQVNGIGPVGVIGQGTGAAGIGVQGEGSGDNGVGGSFFGPFVVGSPRGRSGQFIGEMVVWGGARIFGGLQVITGPKSAVVAHPDGTHRQLYCMESPESWFEDFGRAQLSEGSVRVSLEEGFAALVDTETCHVFLTAEGECMGLYVSERSQQDFEVREQSGGTSSVSFSYRIAARRADISVERLAAVETPTGPPEP